NNKSVARDMSRHSPIKGIFGWTEVDPMAHSFGLRYYGWSALLISAVFTALINASGQDQVKDASPAGQISGCVTIQGKLAPGIAIELQPNTISHIKDPAIAKTMTDAQGRYHFINVAPNKYWVKADAVGFVTQPWDIDGPGRRVAVATGASVQGVDINLLRGGVMSGRILDADGNPVADQRVLLIYPTMSTRYAA